MRIATRRAALVAATGGLALMFAAIDDHGRADYGVLKKGDRQTREITVACTPAVVSDAMSTCETLTKSGLRLQQDVTYVTTSFQDGPNTTTLVRRRLEK